ncbi:MAG: NmrA family NAD(P)-binding protein [Alkalispirochaeta sp.]
MAYVIIGGTGQVGSACVQELIDRGEPVRVQSRDPEKNRDQFPEADWHRFDLVRDEPPVDLWTDVKAMLLVRPPAISNVGRYIVPVLASAHAAGVEHVVFVSVLGAHRIPMIPHYKIEREITRIGFTADFLRAGFFMQNLVSPLGDWIREERRIVVPAGKGAASFVDARDIGRAAALLLTGEVTVGGRQRHERVGHDVTGSRALTHEEVAAIMSEELDQPIEYDAPGYFAFIRTATERGWERPYARLVARLYLTIRLGLSQRVTDDLRRILGKGARSVREFIHDYRDCWL